MWQPRPSSSTRLPAACGRGKPENYHTLTWTLEDQGGTTKLTLSQDNNATEEAAEHSPGMWDMLMADVKKIAERP